MLHDTRTLCAFFNYKGDIKMCGFLVVGSEEFELQVFQKALDKAAYRGPDYQHVSIDHGITWGFNRLSIMDLSTNGNQPFVYKDYTLVCNGEIYNYPALKTKLESSYTFKSGSDCEVLIPLYEQYGLEILCKYLDAEFALVLFLCEAVYGFNKLS